MLLNVPTVDLPPSDDNSEVYRIQLFAGAERSDEATLSRFRVPAPSGTVWTAGEVSSLENNAICCSVATTTFDSNSSPVIITATTSARAHKHTRYKLCHLCPY